MSYNPHFYSSGLNMVPIGNNRYSGGIAFSNAIMQNTRFYLADRFFN